MKIFVIYSIILIGIVLLFTSTYNEMPSVFEKPLIELSILTSPFFDKPSPSDWIKENQIEVYPDRIIIYMENPTISRYAPTKSMDPFLDDTSTGISITPKSPEQLQTGDIISYSPSPNSNYLIVHRIIKIGQDEQGWFAITQGDNAIQNDGKVRFEQIKRVLIAIIY